MIPDIRKRFNAAFKQERYDAMIQDINTSYRFPMDFHLCETPFFISAALAGELLRATREISAILRTPEYLEQCKAAVPPGLAVPNETYPSTFLQFDFAICRGEDGAFTPQLIELQGFPTLFGFQWLLARRIPAYFDLHPDLRFYFEGHTEESYLKLLREAVVGKQDPENVVLLEVEPEQQKTRIDFAITEALLGIHTVCLTKVIKRGDKLFYRNESGTEVPIHRIYNRTIFDDLSKRNLQTQFTLTDPVDVEWAGHPNWFFKISKYSLPLIKSRYAPPCYFLRDLHEYPPDLGNYVLKPLYSFSGMGVELDITLENLDALDNREQYILQRKIEYAPLIETPEGLARAEVRILMIWPDGAPEPEILGNLVRMSKGRMMGTRYNKDRAWVGSSLGFYML